MSRALAKKAKPTPNAKVVSLANAQAARTGVVIGTVARHDAEGIWVDHPGNDGPSVLARAAVPVAPGAVTLSAGQSVVLLLDHAGSPVVIGLLQPLPVPGAAPTGAGVQVKLDGSRLEFEAHDEIVLKCGESSIVLRRNGRVEIRGVRVESRAKGVNRIKGGTVSIN
jgi:hypothetical protein